MAETKLRATHFVKGDRWVYLRSNIKGITSHSLLRHEEKEFPFDRVQTWLTDDKRIVQVCKPLALAYIQVTYGDGYWVILCHRYDFDMPRVGKQTLSVTNDFPEDKIKAAWKNNERVTILSYCNGQWVLITEEQDKDTPVVGQSLVTYTEVEDLKGEIAGWWKKNKAVQILTAGEVDGTYTWVMIGQQLDKSPGQGFFADSDWPMEKIGQHYKNKKYIVNAAWHEKEEYWVIITGPVTGGQSLSTTEEFPVEKVSELENLYQYGKRD